MRILVACEESQVVTIEARKRGHEAYSCDIIECSGGHPEWHIKQDVLPLLNGFCEFETMDGGKHYIDSKWSMIIAHPPCTYLSAAGASRLHKRIDGKSYCEAERLRKGLDAQQFFMAIYNANCKKIAIENAVPLKIFGLPQYSQTIQPYEFGDPWMKTTCLWLKGLPILFATDIVVPEGKWVSASDHRKTKARDKWQTAGKRSQKDRSKTFPGIAKAMIDQWAGDAV